jgi:hypothetical protein
MIIDRLEPWRENSVYPGKHWLLYTATRAHYYVAEIHHDDYHQQFGAYQWRVWDSSHGNKSNVGYCETLEDAKQAVSAYFETHNAEELLNTQEREKQDRLIAEQIAREQARELAMELAKKQQLSLWS